MSQNPISAKIQDEEEKAPNGFDFSGTLSLLIEEAKNERIKLLLKRFEKDFQAFKEKLGEEEFRNAFQQFMMNKLEMKLIAAKKIVDHKK